MIVKTDGVNRVRMLRIQKNKLLHSEGSNTYAWYNANQLILVVFKTVSIENFSY